MQLFEYLENSLQNTAQGKALLSSRGVLCALSGGADSVFLLHFLKEYLKGSAVTLYCAHFNHQIRGEEADRDEDFCRGICERLDVELFCGSADIPKIAEEISCGLEECARIERYKFLLSLAKEKGLSLATAHNASDNTETLIFNLVRGSGISGMCGIAPLRVREGVTIVRPLLSVTGDEIRSCLNENNIPFVVDSTNEDINYSRNYVRHIIIPALKNINTEVDAAAKRLSSSARYAVQFISDSARPYVTDEPIARENLASLDDALLHEIIIQLYEKMSGTRNNLSDSVISEAAKMIKSEGQGKLAFPKGKSLCVDRHFVYFEPQGQVAPESVILSENQLIPFGEYFVGFYNNPQEFKALDNNIYKLFISSSVNCDSIIGKIFVRTRQAGDTVSEHSVNKKVKKLLCDRDIPLHLRNTWPVFCDDEGIVYVPNTVISDRVFTKSTDGVGYLLLCKE